MIAVTGSPATPPLGYLLAIDIGQIIGALIPLVALLFWVLNQIFGNEQQPAPKRQAQRPQPRPAARPAPRPGQQRQAAAGDVNDEVAEFLRRAAQKRGGQPAADVEVVRPQPARPAPRRLRPADEVIATAEVIEEPRRRPVVAAQSRPPAVKKPVEKMRRLQSTLEEADERMEEHLHSVFEHRLGSLESSRRAPAPKAAPPSAAAAEISQTPMAAAGFAALLGNSESLRRAIVLSEILERPEHRW